MSIWDELEKDEKAQVSPVQTQQAASSITEAPTTGSIWDLPAVKGGASSSAGPSSIWDEIDGSKAAAIEAEVGYLTPPQQLVAYKEAPKEDPFVDALGDFASKMMFPIPSALAELTGREVPLDTLQAVGRGPALALGETPQTAGSFLQELGETASAGPDYQSYVFNKFAPPQLRPESATNNFEFLTRWASMMATPMGKEILAREALQERAKTSDVDELLAETGKNIIKRNKQFISDRGLDAPEKNKLNQLLFDVGHGGTSLAVAYTVAQIMGPTAPSIAFGLLQKASMYQQLTDAGVNPAKASNFSTYAGGIEGILEFWGLDKWLNASGNAFFRTMVRTGTEVTQEMSQELGGDLIATAAGLPAPALEELTGKLAYTALVTTLLSLPFGVAVSVAERQGAQTILMDHGLSEEQANKYVNEFVKRQTQKLASMAENKSALEDATAQAAKGVEERIIEERQAREIATKPAIEIAQEFTIDESEKERLRKAYTGRQDTAALVKEAQSKKAMKFLTLFDIDTTPAQQDRAIAYQNSLGLESTINPQGLSDFITQQTILLTSGPQVGLGKQEIVDKVAKRFLVYAAALQPITSERTGEAKPITLGEAKKFAEFLYDKLSKDIAKDKKRKDLARKASEAQLKLAEEANAKAVKQIEAQEKVAEEANNETRQDAALTISSKQEVGEIDTTRPTDVVTEKETQSPLIAAEDNPTRPLNKQEKAAQRAFKYLTGQTVKSRVGPYLDRKVREYTAFKTKLKAMETASKRGFREGVNKTKAAYDALLKAERQGNKAAAIAAKARYEASLKEARQARIITEQDALKIKLKASEAASRIGFKAGVSETQKKLKADVENSRLEMERVERIIAETKALEKRILAIAKTKNMMPNYKKAVEILLQGKDLKKANVGELRAIYSQLKAVQSESQRVKQIFNKVSGVQQQAVKQVMLNQLKSLPKYKAEGKSVVTRPLAALRNSIDGWLSSGLMPNIIIKDLIDAAKDMGAGFFLLDKPVLDSIRQAQAWTQQDNAAFVLASQEFIAPKQLRSTVELSNGQELPYALALNIFAARNDMVHLKAIIDEGVRDQVTGEKYSLQFGDVRLVFESLTENDRKFVEAMEKTITSKVYGKTNPVFERTKGRKINQLPGWWTMHRDGTQENFGDNVADEMLARETGRNPDTVFDAGKSRKSNATGTLQGNYFQNLSRLIRQSNRFAAMADVVQHHKRLLGDREVREQLIEKIGEKNTKTLENWLDTLTTGRRADIKYEHERSILSLTQNASLSMITWKLAITAKQVPSWLTALGTMKRTEVSQVPGALAKMAAHPVKMFSFVNTKSVIMGNRARKGFESVMREFSETTDPFNWISKDKRANWQTVLLRMGDFTPAYSSWLAVYDAAITEGESEAEAIDRADRKILTTQPLALAEYLPETNKGVLGKVAFVFKNQLNKNFNTTYDIFKQAQNKRITKGQALMKYAVSIATPSLLIGMITRGRLPEPEEAVLDIISGTLSGANIAVMMIVSALTSMRYGEAGAPIFARPLFGIGRALKQWMEGKAGPAIIQAIRALLLSKGLPDTTVAQPFIGLERLLTGKTTDLGELIYSEKYREMQKPKSKKKKRAF